VITSSDRGVTDRVLALRGDGLSAIEPWAVQAVVMAGMSADSMLRLLDAAPHVLARLEQLILQANQNMERIRAWALRSGWHLRDERMLEERGRFFVVCAFARAPGEDPAYAVPGWTGAALCNVGPLLLARRDVVALRWFERQRERLSRWVERGVTRLQPELALWQAACEATRTPAEAFDQAPSDPFEPNADG
jgi:tRNA A22 N-methylase